MGSITLSKKISKNDDRDHCFIDPDFERNAKCLIDERD